MHIGLAGPVDLTALRGHITADLPAVYSHPATGGLARAWLEQGHRLTLYLLSTEVRQRTVHGDGSPLRIVVVPRRVRHSARDLFRTERAELAAAMRDHPADVVNAHWTYEFAVAAVGSGLPACVTAQDTPVRCAWEMRDGYRWLRHSLAVPAVHRATALSAISPYVAQHLRRCLFVRRPVKVIPNGVDLADMPRAEPSRPVRDAVFAAALQGWGPLKNGSGLLAAFARVRQRMSGARLVLFGAGFEPGGPAERWAASRGIGAGVEFAGPTEHSRMLRRLAQEADVMVHPSFVEGFSVTVAEAMAVGVPVVAGARSGAVPWVLGDGRAGVLSDVGDPVSLAEAMALLARDQERRVRLVEAARRRVDQHFGIHEVAKGYVRWFETVA